MEAVAECLSMEAAEIGNLHREVGLFLRLMLYSLETFLTGRKYHTAVFYFRPLKIVANKLFVDYFHPRSN